MDEGPIDYGYIHRLNSSNLLISIQQDEFVIFGSNFIDDLLFYMDVQSYNFTKYLNKFCKFCYTCTYYCHLFNIPVLCSFKRLPLKPISIKHVQNKKF